MHQILPIKAYGFPMHQQIELQSRSASPHVGHPKPRKWRSIRAVTSVSACAVKNPASVKAFGEHLRKFRVWSQ